VTLREWERRDVSAAELAHRAHALMTNLWGLPFVPKALVDEVQKWRDAYFVWDSDEERKDLAAGKRVRGDVAWWNAHRDVRGVSE